MTVHELETRLGELSEESAVFFGLFGVDANGAIVHIRLGIIARTVGQHRPDIWRL